MFFRDFSSSRERQLLLVGYVLRSPFKLLFDCLVFVSYATLFYGMAYPADWAKIYS